MNAPADSAIWASLPSTALILDAQNCIRAANAAAEQFLNVPEHALAGLRLNDVLTADVMLEEALARARRNLAPIFLNDVGVGAWQRAPIPASIQIAPMADRPGAVLVLVTPREIAERMGRGLSMKAAAKSAVGMAQMLAHEIKNPLAGIAGAAQLLSMSLSEQDREMTDLIVAETRRVVKLLDQVEQFGNQRPPDRVAVNLHDVLERARRTAQLGFAAHMTITEEYDPSLPDTLADADQLQQVFLNLLRNAAEAADPQGGTIRLRTSFDHRLRVRGSDGRAHALPLQVEIIDDGPGLPPEITAEIFDPFISGRANGTGLGLALVSKIISDHDGWIAVDSAPGRTVFRMSFPMAPTTTEKH